MDHIQAFYSYLLTEKLVSLNSYKSYKLDIQQFVQFLSEHNLDIKSATLTDLKLFLQKLEERKISARSRARKISSLKLLYSYLEEHYDIPNIASQLIMPQIEYKLPEILTEQETIDLFKPWQGDQDYHRAVRAKLIVLLLYCTGIRVSELAALEWIHINNENRFITILNGKGGKQRQIPYPDILNDYLMIYYKTHFQWYIDRNGKTDYVFPVRVNKQTCSINRNSVLRIVKSFCKDQNVREVSPHVLRHSIATHLLKNGANLRFLQILLGHSRIDTTTMYTHLDMGYIKKSYDKKHPRA